MIIKGLPADIIGVFANLNDKEAIQNLLDGPLTNNDSPLADAQRIEDIYDTLKQKRPVVFEYVQKNNNGKLVWKTIELYINPESMTIASTKIIGKQITRGGIFYHHWGSDDAVMQISGYTGLSGMKGIEQLEELYYASGTLLKWQKFGPEKKQISAEPYETIDYNDPINVLESVTKFSKQKNQQIQQQIKQKIEQTQPPKPVYWNGSRMNVGQIGKVQILKTIPLFRCPDLKKIYLGKSTKVRDLKPGESYRVYAIIKHPTYGTIYNLGANQLIRYDPSAVKYTAAPSSVIQQTKQYAEQIQRQKNEINSYKRNQHKVLYQAISSYLNGITNFEYADKISKVSEALQVWQQGYMKKYKHKPPSNVFYKQALNLFKTHCKGLDSTILIQLAYEYTLSNYNEDELTNDIKSMNVYNTVPQRNINNDLRSLYDVKNIEDHMILVDPIQYGDPVYWNGSTMNVGQIGKVQILKPTKLWKKDQNGKDVFIRDLKPGESYRVYAIYDNNRKIDVGAGAFIYNNPGYVKYEAAPANLVEKAKAMTILDNEISAKVAKIAAARAAKIQHLLTELDEFYAKESAIRAQLKSTIQQMVDLDFGNIWEPRKVICYFENRAYIGHIDYFSYSRVAQTPLIKYDLKFTITKQVVGTMDFSRPGEHIYKLF